MMRTAHLAAALGVIGLTLTASAGHAAVVEQTTTVKKHAIVMPVRHRVAVVHHRVYRHVVYHRYHRPIYRYAAWRGPVGYSLAYNYYGFGYPAGDWTLRAKQ
jgi:hypothetical protein